jgi:hypothetical protein
MFIRISLIAAIVAALTIACLNTINLKHTTSLATDRDREKKLKETAQAGLADSTLKLAAVTKELNVTKFERDEASARADAESRKALNLAAALKAAQDERDSARNELAAWKTGPIPFTDVQGILSALKTVTGERDALRVKLYRAHARLARICQGDDWEMPKDLKGQVAVSDPKYGFVILNVGEDQGVLEGGRLLVHRDGRLIGKVRITSTEQNRSIANVLPGWQIAEVKEGDQILVQ